MPGSHPPVCATASVRGMAYSLERVLAHSEIRTLFQPIFDGGTGSVFGVEALTRGEPGSPLESPQALFGAALAENRLEELERACIASALRSFAKLRFEGRLFLNV